MTEEWRHLVEYPFYEVSNLGRVRRLYRTRPCRILKPWICTKGYRQLTLSMAGVIRRPLVHQLVAWAFIGPPPDDGQTYDVHHKQTKANDHADNLEYILHREHWRKTPRRRR